MLYGLMPCAFCHIARTPANSTDKPAACHSTTRVKAAHHLFRTWLPAKDINKFKHAAMGCFLHFCSPTPPPPPPPLRARLLFCLMASERCLSLICLVACCPQPLLLCPVHNHASIECAFPTRSIPSHASPLLLGRIFGPSFPASLLRGLPVPGGAHHWLDQMTSHHRSVLCTCTCHAARPYRSTACGSSDMLGRQGLVL